MATDLIWNKGGIRRELRFIYNIIFDVIIVS